MSDETRSYKITGLVDQFDEQNNITGQYPVGSVQLLPVEFGDKEVELGHAEVYEGEDVDEEETATGETGEAGDADEDGEGEGDDEDDDEEVE